MLQVARHPDEQRAFRPQHSDQIYHTHVVTDMCACTCADSCADMCRGVRVGMGADRLVRRDADEFGLGGTDRIYEVVMAYIVMALVAPIGSTK